MMKVQSGYTVFQRGDLARKVSVIVPLHNYAALIEETLDTVAAQTFEDVALIVVDDASTDDSRAVVERWMRDLTSPHLTLVLLANETNAGLSVTRNTGTNLSRSEYCFFLDADNLLFPRCLEKHVRALEARVDCVGAYSILEEFGSQSALIGANVFSRERLKKGNYIDAMAMLRRQALDRVEGFLPIKHGWEDYELWLRLCETGERMLHLPEILSRYRHHQKSMLRQQTNVGQNIVDLHRNLEQLHPWIQLDAPRAGHRSVAPPPKAGTQLALSNTRSKTIEPKSKRAAVDAGTLKKTLDKPAPSESVKAAQLGSGAYEAYKNKIFAKLETLATRPSLPVNVDVDTDYTGPVQSTPFDRLASERQRADNVKQIERMLRFGIVGINPRPGVHAARQESGDFIRYTSLLASDEPVSRLPDSMLIHIHAFYPDVVEEMLDYFISSATQGRFLITTTTSKNRDEIACIMDERDFPAHDIILIENKGRDIGPFLDHAIDYASNGDVICHIHTKKSPDVGATYGEVWRRSLYGTLLTQAAVDAFDDGRLGLLFADTSRSVGWGKNRSFCEDIATKLGSVLRPHPGPIPTGNMFFARTEVARAMRDATREMEWPREPVPYDGSVLHAIERMWPVACEQAGFKWAAIHNRSGVTQ